MTPAEMAKAATEAIQNGCNMSMVLPSPWRNRPPKFPRGELMCEGQSEHRGTYRVYSFDPMKVLAWLAAHKLIEVQITKIPSEPNLTTNPDELPATGGDIS